eukprot:4938-Heterococcus_DN1.PRE.2
MQPVSAIACCSTGHSLAQKHSVDAAAQSERTMCTVRVLVTPCSHWRRFWRAPLSQRSSQAGEYLETRYYDMT